MLAAVVELIVDAEAERQVWVFRRRADEDALRAALGEMQLGLVAASDKAGRFQDDIHAEIFPRQISRIAFLQDLNFMAANDDIFRIETDFAVELAVDRVPFQKVRERMRVGEIIDRGDALNIALVHRAEDVAPDSAEAIDTVGS